MYVNFDNQVYRIDVVNARDGVEWDKAVAAAAVVLMAKWRMKLSTEECSGR